MATVNVKDAAGTTVAIEKPNANGRAAADDSRPVALADEDLAAIAGISAALGAATFFPATQPVSGAVTISAPVAVTGTFWQATQPVSVASLPLPAGAATSAKQDSQTTLLTAIDTKLGGPLAVTGAFYPATQPVSGTVAISGSVAVTGTFWQATQPVSLASQPLPSGAATSALQTTGNTALSGIVTALGGTLLVSAAALPLPSGAATSAKQDAVIAAVNALAGSEYETVAASQAAQTLGATGAVGDLLVALTIVPATTSPGAVSIKDGSGGPDIVVFAGGTSSVATLHPFTVQLGLRAGSAGWRVNTGANVSVIAAGDFT
jgi:hypothetical protein